MKTAEYKRFIADLCESEFGQKVDIELSSPGEQFGDISTNVAMQLAGKTGEKPREIADKIVKKLRKNDDFAEVAIAGPGFINIKLKDSVLFVQAQKATELNRALEGKTIVCEYSDANPFKALHAGHLYTTLVGDALSNILEAAGAKVHRVNFGGDVGLHVAKAIWGVIQKLGGENPGKLDEINKEKRSSWVSARYVEGNNAFENDESAKTEIPKINQKIYDIHARQDKTSPLAQIYWTCRSWSYDGFDDLYSRLNVSPFEKYYPESATIELGLQKVKSNTPKVYEESDGAVVFRGEKHGLFTQVFVTSDGLPTYAGKDVGLIFLKHQDYKPDVSYIITDESQKDHLQVVMKSIEQFAPELVENTVHQTHGRIALPGGRKMSSRAGGAIMATDVLEAARSSAKEDQAEVVLGAVRYSFLKNKVGGNIVYDPKESVSHEGNSGPYLQYALVRARSIIKKQNAPSKKAVQVETLDKYERQLAKHLNLYSEVFSAALNDYSPHHICNYLYELAQIFNRFYENSRVAGDPREQLRFSLVKNYEQVLSHGMSLLGMPKPEKM